MVEVPKSYNDKTGKFAYRFYRTPGMGGDLICKGGKIHDKQTRLGGVL